MAPRQYSMETRAAQAARTRERIMDAALATYRERGIGATSLQAIARHAGVSAATILNHFGSAEALARSVVDELTAALQIPHDRDWTEQGLPRRVRRLVREMFDFYDRSTPWFEIFRAELGVDPALREGAASFWQAIRDLYARVFGVALDDRRVRGAAFGLTHPATLTALREAGLSLDESVDLIANSLISTLRDGAEAED